MLGTLAEQPHHPEATRLPQEAHLRGTRGGGAKMPPPNMTSGSRANAPKCMHFFELMWIFMFF